MTYPETLWANIPHKMPPLPPVDEEWEERIFQMKQNKCFRAQAEKRS